MATFKPLPNDYVRALVAGKRTKLLSNAACNRFDARLLNLGHLQRPAIATDAIAAVFDLQGFTTFCGQIEPQFSVPLFLGEFLPWLMTRLKSEMIQRKYKSGARLWSPLPFFVKFLGDGVLVLWDSSAMSDVARANILVAVSNICVAYSSEFLGRVEAKVVEPPKVLRCGVARGTVYSVGDSNDFVGTCINMAARLQKLPGLTFAFNQRGFHVPAAASSNWITRKVEVRGIGSNELVGMRRSEFRALSKTDKEPYRSVRSRP